MATLGFYRKVCVCSREGRESSFQKTPSGFCGTGSQSSVPLQNSGPANLRRRLKRNQPYSYAKNPPGGIPWKGNARRADQENAIKGTWRILEPEATPVTLRLSGSDLAKAKARARKLGKRDLPLLKDVVHQALSQSRNYSQPLYAIAATSRENINMACPNPFQIAMADQAHKMDGQRERGS